MDAAQIGSALEDVFDQSIVYHGFTDYMRDYEVIIFATADARTEVAAEHLRYLFKFCVQAGVVTAVRPEVWKNSLDERLIEYDTGVDLDGFVWGVKWQMLYPGGELVANSSNAENWSQALGIPFHEVQIQTNGHNLNLTFSDLVVTRVGAGYRPFEVPEGGPDWKIPL